MNLQRLKYANLIGQSGCEKNLVKAGVFSACDGWNRVNSSLYDFENKSTGGKIEVKKQKNQQWLDPTKYTSLLESEEKIPILFLTIDDTGKVEFAHQIHTKKLVDKLWDSDILEAAAKLKEVCPQAQIKCPITTRKFFDENKDISMKVYDSSSKYTAGQNVFDHFTEEYVTIISLDTNVTPTVYTVKDSTGQEYLLSEDDIDC